VGFDKAWSLPEGEFADDVREATERLVCRLGYAEGIEELDKLWGVAPKASRVRCRSGPSRSGKANQVRVGYLNMQGDTPGEADQLTSAPRNRFSSDQHAGRSKRLAPGLAIV
jgi:hypothetical protein